MEPDEIAHLSSEEKKTLFMNVTITHHQLEVVHDRIRRAIRQPAGFSFVLVHGPTGAGKTTLMDRLIEETKAWFLSTEERAALPPFSPYGMAPTTISVLKIEADPPDKTAFNRGYFYRTILQLLGERTYSQQMHVDIHAEAAPSKRRRMSRAATESNDVPELREGAMASLYRHGVRVIFLDEAHHLLLGSDGTGGSTLQEQLEWLKSLSKTGILYVLVGTYDLFNSGKLNGQIGRRCLPVHFPRYQLEREADCIAFQTALLELLRRVPLECPAERWVTDHWLYFYECSVGCIGVLKDWLLRAVSAALDDGASRLSLDCVQDYALPVEIYRQMALDAYEGEQRLNHTASNREHVWRLLQGGELIAPVPPLPPRETVPSDPKPVAGPLNSSVLEGQASLPITSSDEETQTQPVKKTRTRKKPKENPPDETVQENAIQAEAGEVKATPPPKRQRKKTTETVGENAEVAGSASSESLLEAPVLDPPKRRRKKTEDPVTGNVDEGVKGPSGVNGEASSAQVDAAIAISVPKPKRTRRVGEPKPKRYAVGDSSQSESVV